MSLTIVTGGTDGNTDGTAVSQDGAQTNPLTFVTLNTNVAAHIRAATAEQTTDLAFTLPDGIEISFDGGTVWYDDLDNPISAGVTVGAVNVPVLLRQTALVATAAALIETDGAFVPTGPLDDVTNFTGSRSAGDTQVDLSWDAVANRTYYKIERATDSGFTANLTTLSAVITVTSYTDTGRSAATTYYYRIKAVGSGAFTDSTNWATHTSTANSGTLTQYAVTGTATSLQGCVIGPVDANGVRSLWACIYGTGKIVRITPAGVITEFAVASPAAGPVGICSDGTNIWYACTNNGYIVKVSGDLHATPTQTAYSVTAAWGICYGPDGNLWVTSSGTDIRKVNTSGTVLATYSASSGGLRHITTDGTDLYAANNSYSTTGGITRCTTAGSVTNTACPDSGAAPVGITYDATTGRIFMAASGVGKLYKIVPGATPTFTSLLIGASTSALQGVCVGTDGKVYTAGNSASYPNLYSAPAAAFTPATLEIALASDSNGQLCAHPDGTIWVNNNGIDKIGKFIP